MRRLLAGLENLIRADKSASARETVSVASSEIRVTGSL